MAIISWDDFEKIDIRSGTIVKIEEFPRALKPAYKVWVDFGNDLGVRQTSAQITVHYTPETLMGRKVMGCVNLGTKNIAGLTSEVLLLGLCYTQGATLLPMIDSTCPNGEKLH